MSSSDSGTGPGAGETEDLFDFASAEAPPSTTQADELDVDAFLSAVGDLADEEGPSSSGGGMSVDVSDDLRGALVGANESNSKLEDDPQGKPAARLPRSSRNRTAVALEPGAPLLIGLPWPVLAGGGLLIALNAWLVFTLWSSQSNSGGHLKDSARDLERAAESVAAQIERNVDRIENVTNPQTSAVLLDSTTSLAHVERSLELGDHALARRQIYSLLSVVDRLPSERREDTEARAQFLLASVDRLEAESRRSPGRPSGGVR